MKEPKKTHQGKSFKVEHCDGALKSYHQAMTSVTPHKRKGSMLRQLIMLINRLADGKPMSKENFPAEGDLPNKGGKFYAFKKIPIRAYCWRSKKHNNTYFISHYLYKDQDKLKDKDIQRVHKNWREKEE